MRRWFSRYGKGLLFLLALVAGLLFFRSFLDVGTWMTRALAFIASLGPWGPLLFVGLYIFATVFFLPGSLLTLGAGLLFGIVEGSILVSVGSTAGATLAFLVGRYLARERVARRIAGNPRFEAIDRAVAREGWKIVGLTRLSPIFPFNLLNYALGLTRVRLSHYVVASWVGMMPGTVMYVYLGSLAKDLATLGSGHGTRTPAQWAFFLLMGVATLALTLTITRIARRALAEKVA